MVGDETHNEAGQLAAHAYLQAKVLHISLFSYILGCRTTESGKVEHTERILLEHNSLLCPASLYFQLEPVESIT